MKKSLLKSGYVVASMTVLTRIVGLAREIIFANVFGASAGFDAFLVAFKIPNFMRRLFAEGAFSQAFVPVLSEYRQNRSQKEAQIFVNRMAGTLGLTLFIVTAIAVLITPIFVMIFAPGFIHDPTRFGLASAMLRITFPYLLLISLTAFAGSILNSYDIFSIPAITPILLNFSLIGAALFLAPHLKNPVEGLAWGVFIGGILQLLLQLPFLKYIKLLPKPQLCWRDPGVNRVLKLMVPAILGVSVAQISLMLDTLFASFLREGSITWLYYSDRLTNFPLGVFGVALAIVVLPHLSRKHAAKSKAEFSAALDWALRCVLLIGPPSAIGLLLLAGPLLATILQHGQFNDFDVIMASKSLMAFSLGLPAFMLIKILASGFYSTQDIKTPVKIAIIALCSNMVLNLILIFPLAHAGLALATSLTSSLNAGLLLWFLLKRKIYIPQAGWLIYGLRLGFANAAMAAILWFLNAKLSAWLSWNSLQRVEHLLIILVAAVMTYIICLLVAGVRPSHFKAKS
ncbi:MAG: murein biosynthesis integral membrane protein MurJ [Gammaproteobacteria bacterium]|nr:murein biosynthesis integral membrane protein MurJ [Gammaproteobacteria bacterium]